jgi:predicted peroxiredoxin
VVKLTWGVESPERVSQALTVAATAATSGAEVSLWLTGDAVRLAEPTVAENVVLPHAASLPELRDLLLDVGTITVCSQCAARRDLSAEELLPGVRVAGSATFVEEILSPTTTSLVY